MSFYLLCFGKILILLNVSVKLIIDFKIKKINIFIIYFRKFIIIFEKQC